MASALGAAANRRLERGEGGTKNEKKVHVKGTANKGAFSCSVKPTFHVQKSATQVLTMDFLESGPKYKDDFSSGSSTHPS